MNKKIVGIVCLFVLILGFMPSASAAGFADVPGDSWASGYIDEAVELGVMGGYGGNRFGYGDTVKRAQFAAMLVRLFQRELVAPDTPAFEDNADKNAWYYDEIETALKNGAVTSDKRLFRPDDAITRAEMAVMLVRALGFDTLAGSMRNIALPFSDVTANKAYIAMAYDFGIIKGLTDTAFGPSDHALREQAAAMMIRLHDRFYAGLDWTHAFYAVRAYPQIGLIGDFDAVSFSWSRLEFADGQVRLNTAATNGNTHIVPSGAQEVLQTAENAGARRQLCVYLSTSQETGTVGAQTNACTAILTDDENRAEAAMQIASLAQSGGYTGVTIDFEEMRGPALKEGFNAFLRGLERELTELETTLYVCVHPATTDGVYYDAYDYRTIGELADKVILMAHDYAAVTLTPAEMAAGFTATPLTPYYEIYAALKAAADPVTGVSDTGKLVLAVSFDAVQWKTRDGSVLHDTAYRPEPSAVFSRMTDPAAMLQYSDTYQNPYITYHNEADDTDNIIWYEDMRSVEAKAALARMFGVTGLSIWRLGTIPDYPDPESRQVYYDFPTWLTGQL